MPKKPRRSQTRGKPSPAHGPSKAGRPKHGQSKTAQSKTAPPGRGSSSKGPPNRGPSDGRGPSRRGPTDRGAFKKSSANGAPAGRSDGPSRGQSRGPSRNPAPDEKRREREPEAFRVKGPPKSALVVYGRHPVLAELRYRKDAIQTLWCNASTAQALEADLAGHEVRLASNEDLDAMTRGDRHQGIVAHSTPVTLYSVNDIAKSQLVVALDGVEDPRNLGRAVRAAHAFGAGALIVPENHSAPFSGAAFKSAAGALSRLPVVRCTNLRQALETLKAAGHWVFGAEADGEGALWSANMKGQATLVIGGEDRGLRRLTREVCDHVLNVPMAADDVSLNAADATTLFLYEWARQQAI